MKSQGVLHFRACETQALMPSLRLVAGVGEQQSAGAGSRRPTSSSYMRSPRWPAQGNPSMLSAGCCGSQLPVPGAPPTISGSPLLPEGMAGGLIEVADRGADGPGLQWGAVAATSSGRARSDCRVCCPSTRAIHPGSPCPDRRTAPRPWDCSADSIRIPVWSPESEVVTSVVCCVHCCCCRRYGCPPASGQFHGLNRFSNGERQVATQSSQGGDVNSNPSGTRPLR